MATETHELIVQARPEGIQETGDQLDSLSDDFGATAEELDQSAGMLEEFGQELQGASAVIIAGLGTLAAGLLTQIPVIGEAVSGLNAIITSLVLRIDENLRPAIGGLTTSLFGLSDAINTAEGPLGTVVDFLSIFLAVGLGLVAAVGALAGVIAGASAAAGVLGASVAAILAPIALVAAAIAAMAIIWKENIFGIRDILTNFIEAVLEGRWLDALGIMAQGAVSVVTEIIAVFEKFQAAVLTIFEALGALVVSSLKRLGNMAISVIEDTVNAAIQAIPSQIRAELGLGTVSLGQPFDPRSIGDIRQAASQRLGRRFREVDRRQESRAGAVNSQIGRIIAALQNTEQTTTFQIDSRVVARTIEPFLSEGAAGAGVNNRVR